MTAASGGGLPLTAAQTELWHASTAGPDGPAPHTAEYLEIHGPLRPALLARALRRTADEAEALRTRFTDTPDGPRQFPVPLPADGFPLHTADLRRAAGPDAAARTWMDADLARPFDLAAGPPFRQALLRVGDTRWLWYQCAHRLVLDGFGRSLLVRRTAEVYAALAAGRPPGATPFGRLADLVADDLAYRSSEQYGIDRAHWTRVLADLPAAPVTPARPLLRRGARIPDEVTARLRALAGVLRATWAEVLIAAQALHVARTTEASDVVLGLPLMCRLGTAALRVPAAVANVVPLRLEVTPGIALAALVRQVVLGVRAARRHQRFRLGDLRHDACLPGGGRPPFGPLADVMPFDYGPAFAGLPAVPHDLSAGPAGDLALHVYDRADGRGLRIGHDADPAVRTRDDLADHQEEFLALLARVAHADPHAPLARLGTTTGARPRPEPPTAATADRDVPAVTHIGPVDAQARRTPDAPAVVHGDLVLTYAELTARSHLLARRLAARGVGTGALVALALPRSVPLVLGVLAVLKAGGACLPLDPEHPPDRLARLLADAGPVCVLTDRATAGLLPDTGHPRVLLDASDLPDPPSAGPPRAFTLGHPACVIHLPAPTARPRRAVASHAATADPSR